MTVAFWTIAVFLIASAVWVISAKKPVYSVVALLLHFALLAITYLMLSAEFLAVIQIIVYSGAILMLFVFVIALLSSGVDAFPTGPNRLPKATVPALGVVTIALAFLVYGLGRTTVPSLGTAATSGALVRSVGTAGSFGSVADFGRALFSTNLLPFEVTSFILMVAVIGVILLAGAATPYVPSRRRAAEVEKQMHDAVLRAGK
ncbi:MAG: NADH-quinone oxidoreductase subunit J [Candidatus Eremiobacteraeota bacterium]|nr:NADH-quinone oxidoreductase subunit J [Candidatus Eremiobacteraeota bacterium]